MNKSKITVLSLVLVLICSVVVLAAAAAPGSESDPVVTKSYVDQKMSGTAAGSKYVSVLVPQGKKLIGGEGTEIILRSGKATAIDNGVNGISDITSARDLKTSETVPLEHLIIIPRDDGRGIAVSVDSYVLVRGGYTIK